MNWQQLSAASHEEIIEWAHLQPWCQAMAACVQDAEWHAEGDVWTHTKMVLRELTQLDDWPQLTGHERLSLTMTALFHDSAKPLTSQVDPETGRVSSPRHSEKGEHLARAALRELGADLSHREEICRLVRYHGRPPFLLTRADPTHEVVRLSWLVNNRLLYLFAIADTRGRDTDSMSRPEENLLFWKLAAEEADCFEQPYRFPNDEARFQFFRQREPSLHFVPHEKYSCQVILLSGLPGAGKDTWLARNHAGLPVVSLDDLRGELDLDPTDNQGEVAQLARERCREFLRAGTDFAFNATNLLKQTRQRWIDLFADYHAKIQIVYLEPPFERILAQNKRRPSSVPEKIIQKMASKYEPPTWHEAHGLTLFDGVR